MPEKCQFYFGAISSLAGNSFVLQVKSCLCKVTEIALNVVMLQEWKVVFCFISVDYFENKI